MIIQGFVAGNSDLNPFDALVSMPTVFMFVGILFPLNLVNTLICLSYLTITILGILPLFRTGYSKIYVFGTNTFCFASME